VPGYSVAEPTADMNLQEGALPTTYFKGPRKQRRWRELVADRLTEAGVPLFPAVGAHDLSDARVCYGSTDDCTQSGAASAGDNFGWRSSLAGFPAPVGAAGAASGDGLKFAPVSFGDDAQFAPDVEIAPPTGQSRGASVRAGGAHTHYAFDVPRAGEAL